MTVLQIKGRTTGDQSNFNKYALSNNSCIYVDTKITGDSGDANEPDIEEYSIELHLGEGWNDNYSEQNKNLRRIKDSIILQKHGSIVVEVRETIYVPHNRYGIVLPTGSLFLSKGIIITPAKVEPAFEGKLKLRMFNTTNQKITLTAGTKLGSAIFFSTESTKEHEKTSRKSDISSPQDFWWEDLKKFLTTNKTLCIGWIISILSSSMLSSVLIYFLYYQPILEKQNAPVSISEQKTPSQTNQVNKK